jgi:hypothetical protein
VSDTVQRATGVGAPRGVRRWDGEKALHAIHSSGRAGVKADDARCARAARSYRAAAMATGAAQPQGAVVPQATRAMQQATRAKFAKVIRGHSEGTLRVLHVPAAHASTHARLRYELALLQGHSNCALCSCTWDFVGGKGLSKNRRGTRVTASCVRTRKREWLFKTTHRRRKGCCGGTPGVLQV